MAIFGRNRGGGEHALAWDETYGNAARDRGRRRLGVWAAGTRPHGGETLMLAGQLADRSVETPDIERQTGTVPEGSATLP